MGAWLAIHTKPQQEAVATGNLIRAGVRVFFPRRDATISHAGRVRRELRPYLGRYIFAAPLPGQHSVIRHTAGVSLIVGAEAPAVIPDRVMQAFRASFDEDGVFVEPPEPPPEPPLASGASVKITKGPLEGLLAHVERGRLDGSGHIRVIVEMLGGLVATDVLREWVESLREAA